MGVGVGIWAAGTGSGSPFNSLNALWILSVFFFFSHR